MYRKAALRIVKDLGEDKLPEGAAETTSPTGDPADTKEEVVVKQDGSVDPTAGSDEGRKTTTEVREPLTLPKDISVTIDVDNLGDYIGPPIYQKDRLYTRRCPAGVSQGLGYTGNGSGSVMPIEASVMPGNGSITLTGKLGEVIRESAQIGLSFIKANAYHLGLTESPTQDLVDKKSVHLHMPEGSVGKGDVLLAPAVCRSADNGAHRGTQRRNSHLDRVPQPLHRDRHSVGPRSVSLSARRASR